jgi:BON domain
MMVELKRISTALGLLAALSTSALAQGSAPNANQLTADSVAGTLRASRNLAGHRIAIQARNGVVTLTGELGSPAQKAEALARTQYVAGVRSVVDQLSVSNESAVRTVQYQPNPALAYGLGHHGGQFGGDVVYGGGTGAPVNGGVINGGPVTSGPISGGPSNDGGPMPEGPAGMAGATQASQPGYPNYAWPSYAPYPNFSAVGYPTAYPWQAWPNIGPFYPYPEVPQDWRAVTLRWDDGVWWLDFKKHYTRPFFTPYPFGLFAY